MIRKAPDGRGAGLWGLHDWWLLWVRVVLAADEVDEGGVERIGAFPQAGMAAGYGAQSAPGIACLQQFRQAHGDQDVLLTRQHQRRHLDLAPDGRSRHASWITASCDR